MPSLLGIILSQILPQLEFTILNFALFFLENKLLESPFV